MRPRNSDGSKHAVVPSTDSALTSALERLLRDADRRELQIGSLTLAALLVLAIGLGAIFAPNLAWGPGTTRLEAHHLPLLVSGLVLLTILLMVYVDVQRRMLHRTRQALLEQVARADRALTDSLIDPLTGAFNRRFMKTLLARESKRSTRTGSAFSVLMIDADGFGEINNRLGHAEGDRLLVDLTRLLLEVFRESDTVIRYGGDEFLVFLPDTNEVEAEIATGRLRRRAETSERLLASSGSRIRLSCGAATYRRGSRVEDVVKSADRQMYADKGRRPAGASEEAVPEPQLAGN